jgi:CDP-paratose 2-epimerase
MKILITGSSGLIGSAAVEYFDSKGHYCIGVDNNMRMEFFGEAGDTSWNMHRLFDKCRRFTPEVHDIRDRMSMQKHVFDKYGPFDAVIHCAAQPSHDKARDIPVTDFEVNALGTMNMLELTRQNCPNAVFIFTSTNKVYGDRPNYLPLIELPTRYDYSDGRDGISEKMSIDHCTHSIFGASKVGADVMTQEYGRYYGMKTVVFRGGCLTGPTHSSAELHGFLSYLVKCAITGREYTVFGYNGKQVRDNIHSIDVAKAFDEVIKSPPAPGTVYNIGGCRENSISIMEAITKVGALSGKKLVYRYVDKNRVGDHICYITNMDKFKTDYPNWKITKSLDQIFTELIGATSRGTTTERYMPGDGEDDYFESYAEALLPYCKGRVIDIGCGHGYLTHRIADSKKVEHVTGTDKEAVVKQNHRKSFYWTIDTKKLVEIEDVGLFDTIISTEHIEHLGEHTQLDLIEWVKRHLKLDGVFAGSMPGHDNPGNPNIFHLKTYSQEEWRTVLSQHFKRVHVWKTSDNGYCWSCGL